MSDLTACAECGGLPNVCGTGGWSGPKPGDPAMDVGSIFLTASPAVGGIALNWNYPSTNQAAVAHTKIYRNSSGDFAGAIQIAFATGTGYLDRMTDVNTFYYWIRLVSVNGTEGDLIGPASATSRAFKDDITDHLDGGIDDNHLAPDLRTEINRINLNYQEYLDEVDRRLSNNTAWQNALALVNQGLAEAVTVINTESYERIEGQNALAAQISILGVANANANTAILTEREARVSADEALASDFIALNAVVNHPSTGLPATRATLSNNYYTKANTDYAISQATLNLVSQTGLNNALNQYTTTAALNNNYFTKTDTNNAIASATQTLVAQSDLNNTLSNYVSTAALETRENAKIGYSSLAGTSTPYDGNGSSIVYPEDQFPASTYPQYQTNRRRIIDWLGVHRWNNYIGTPQLQWNTGLPLAQAIKNVQVANPSGGFAALESAMQAQQTISGELIASRYIKLDVNGYVTGYGLYNTGKTSNMMFNVDNFVIGKNGISVIPFKVEGNTTYIENAVIKNLKAENISTNGVSVFVATNLEDIIERYGRYSSQRIWLGGQGISIVDVDATGIIGLMSINITTTTGSADEWGFGGGLLRVSIHKNANVGSNFPGTVIKDYVMTTGTQMVNITFKDNPGTGWNTYHVALTTEGSSRVWCKDGTLAIFYAKR